MEYKYALYTWSGFYNDEYKHNYVEGLYLFDTEEERQNYIRELRSVEKDMKVFHLMLELFEGYNCDKPTVLHRVSEFNGKRVHTKDESYILRTYSSAEYYMQYRWYAGHNDYPFGEDFDYEQDGFRVVQEWIEGSFDINLDEY